MTRGGAATPEPFDISEISRSGDVFDALAARRHSEPAGDPAASDDPAVRLLAALVADVDTDAPPLPAPHRPSHSKPGRPVVRAFVTFGAATVMLASAGAAVAGGGDAHRHDKAAGPPVTRMDVSERSKTEVGAVPVAQPGPVVDGPGRTGRDPAPRESSRRAEPDPGRHPSGPPAGRPSSAPEHTPADHGTGGVGPTPRVPAVSPTPSPSVPATEPPRDDPPPDAAPRAARPRAGTGRASRRGGLLGRALDALTGRTSPRPTTPQEGTRPGSG